MSIITSASSASVSRGYSYFKEDKVQNVNQLNDFEFEGYVEGSAKDPYYVKINIKHPKKSYCDCPHAKGNIICKHMAALYFELFPDEADDYESWLNCDYEDEYYDEDEWNYENCYDDYYFEEEDIYSDDKYLFFDEVLDAFINDLNTVQLKELLLTELRDNKERTYDLYLKKNYKKYLEKTNSNFLFLDKLNSKVQDLINYNEYYYNDFNKEILNSKDKKKIEELYNDKSLQLYIDKILLNEKLAVYINYIWITKFYKKVKSNSEIEKYCTILNNYLDSLKHYSIKNSTIKSNVLINIYILKNFTEKELANSLLKNAKYTEYVDYIINDSDNILELYSNFMHLVNKNYLKNKTYIPEVLYSFARVTNFENNDIMHNLSLYGFLCNGEINYLGALKCFLSESKIIKLVESKTKNVFLLVKLYKFFNKKDELWNLLVNSNYSYLLIDNIEILKDKYNEKLYNHFTSEFYTTLKEGKNREVYLKAMKYIRAIAKLNNKEKFINKIIIDLKNSDYKKCTLLFDEIYKIYNPRNIIVK